MNKLITPTGKQKLEEELTGLKRKRILVANKIKDAKELGDLSENAEYHAAKEEQGFIESRIAEIVAILKIATLVKPNSSKSKVYVGSKITVKTGSEIFEYEIVGSNEADPGSGKISAESPLGAAFLNRKKEEEVDVLIPSGKIKFKIVDIK